MNAFPTTQIIEVMTKQDTQQVLFSQFAIQAYEHSSRTKLFPLFALLCSFLRFSFGFLGLRLGVSSGGTLAARAARRFARHVSSLEDRQAPTHYDMKRARSCVCLCVFETCPDIVHLRNPLTSIKRHCVSITCTFRLSKWQLDYAHVRLGDACEGARLTQAM